MDVKEKMQKALLNARAICDTAEEAKRDFTPEERDQVEGYLKEAKDLKEKLQQAEGDAKLREAVLALGGMDLTQTGQPGQKTPAGQPAAKGTLGERFVNAPAFKAWMEGMGGRLPDSSGMGNSPPVQVKELLKLITSRRKDLITGSSDTSAGAFIETDYTGIYEPLGRFPLSVLDLVQRRTTGSDLVQFVRQTIQVTQATPVAEANVTEYSGATGEVSGEKPEGAVAYTPVTEPVKTIAVWIPATRQALSDVGQLRGLIDQELRADSHEELEDQLVNGDGVGSNFTGVLNTAGILTQAFDTDLLTTVRRARTHLFVTGRSRPTAMVLHPNDAERFDLLTDDTGRFYFGGPIAGDTQRIWRVPVVESVTVSEGTGLMGDWRKAVLWDRESANILVTDSHADFFIRNLIAILCELRAAFGVIRPSGFCVIDLEAGS